MKLILIPFLAFLSISFNSYAETIRDREASDFFRCDLDGGGLNQFAFHRDKNILSEFIWATGAFIRSPAALNNGIIESTYLFDGNEKSRITYYINTNNFSYKKIHKGTFTKYKMSIPDESGQCIPQSKETYLSSLRSSINNIEGMCFIENKGAIFYSSYFCEKLCKNGINNPTCN